jgi:pimeloyl-ACP methyl ester carboxylesterase
VITPDEWRAGGATFRWRDHDIFTRTGGAGDPVVALHGFPTASWDFAPIWGRLTERYRAVTLDFIGFGFSAKPRDFAYSILAYADLVDALLAREGITRYRLLAHDMGVTVAQELLARQKENAAARVTAVVLLNGGLFPETHRPRRAQTLLASRVGPILARLMTYGAFARSMHGVWGQKPPAELELRAMWQLVTAHDGMAVMPKVIGYMAERRTHRERWVGALVGAEVPIRLVNGLRDPVSGAHMLVRYRELVGKPDIVELPDVGHYPQVEAPDAVANATLDFFARASRASSQVS